MTQEAQAAIEPVQVQVQVRMTSSPAHSGHKQSGKATERLVLTGFMGSGKSTVGRMLAERLGWTFLDLDRAIEQRTGETVAALFAERGEAAFRKEETLALAAALRLGSTVIALGGGAPETLSNRLLLEQTPGTAVVYLSAPFATLTSRCAMQACDPTEAARPLLADARRAEERFAARQPMYLRLAHHVIETAQQDPKDTVAAVLSMVHPGA